MAELRFTLSPRLQRNSGRRNTVQIPVPEDKTIKVDLTLDASTMTATQEVKLGLEVSTDAGQTWSEYMSITAKGAIPAGGTKGDPLHPTLKQEIAVKAGMRVRGFEVVTNGPFAYGVDIVAEWQ